MNASSVRALGGLVLISFLFTQAAPAYATDAPSPKPTPAIRLEDLGFKNLETKPNLELQSDLDRRHSMLGLHQTMAFVTWGLMAGTVLLSEQAKSNDWHQRLGMVTGASYYTTAYLSMFAPDPLHASGTSGLNIKIHKILRWIHLPLMLLMPIAGLQANDAIKHHKEEYGLGKYKQTMGAVAFASYTLAGGVMLFEF